MFFYPTLRCFFYCEDTDMLKIFTKGSDIVREMFYLNCPDYQREGALLELEMTSESGQ